MSELPITAHLAAIGAALDADNRAVLVAEPGAGKTTRVPLALLDTGWCREGKLLLLEPRRVAARLAARFMAGQLGEEVGETVGYRMRGENRTGPKTRLEVVTPGVLLRQLQDDPMLESVAGIIFDEFHERGLEADLGLTLALDAQQGLRDDLRLLVMSATLDVAALQTLLGAETPLIECPGRGYPVETRYRPLRTGAAARGEVAAQQAAVVAEALADNAGDVLVILPGVAEIRRLARALHEHQTGQEAAPRVVELHGRLALEAQSRALQPDPEGRRRVVLGTAIAESSVTVDGVRAVIDAGFERVPVYQPRSGQTRLATRRVNRASADQRRGRAGRQAPGVCYRLWAEEQPLVPHAEPEILQADLAPVAFELARWGVHEASALAWVTPPPHAALVAGREVLQRLGVLNEQGYLTTLGRRCGRWPTHPRLAVMLERAAQRQHAALACALVALLDEPGSDGEEDLSIALHQRLAAPGEHRPWHQVAKRLARIAGVRLSDADSQGVGELLALAYPERIGQRVSPGRFRLSGGGQAVLPETHALAHAGLLVVADMGGNSEIARIFRAARLSEAQLTACYPEVSVWQARVSWSDDEGRLIGEQVRRFGALVLASRPHAALPAEAVREALLAALQRRGALPFDDTGQQLRGRIALLRRECGESWPDWSEPVLLAGLTDWLGPYLDGINRLEAIARLPLGRYLLDSLDSLDGSLRKRLDELAPQHLMLPSGNRVRLDYRPCLKGEAPVLAAKLQELFGWRSTPRLVDGKIAPLVHLLSPAQRPLQMTRDLASFWASGYAEVRKELRGRYPKHPWPECPLSAVATAKTKRRS